MYTRPNPSVTCWYIYIYYINTYTYIYIYKPWKVSLRPSAPGHARRCMVQGSNVVLHNLSVRFPLSVHWGGVCCPWVWVWDSIHQIVTACNSPWPPWLPLQPVPVWKRVSKNLSQHCETNYDRIVGVLTFRMMSTFFNFLSAGLLHKPFGFYRGHLKLASTVAGMPVMERASLMRLMHRLLYWGVPEETRLTWCVAQFRNESIIEDWSA